MNQSWALGILGPLAYFAEDDHWSPSATPGAHRAGLRGRESLRSARTDAVRMNGRVASAAQRSASRASCAVLVVLSGLAVACAWQPTDACEQLEGCEQLEPVQVFGKAPFSPEIPRAIRQRPRSSKPHAPSGLRCAGSSAAQEHAIYLFLLLKKESLCVSGRTKPVLCGSTHTPSICHSRRQCATAGR